MGLDGPARWGWALSQDSCSVQTWEPAGITQLLMKPAVYWVLSWRTVPLRWPGDNMPHFSDSALPLFSCHYLLLDTLAALWVGSTDTNTFFSLYFLVNAPLLPRWKHTDVTVLFLKVTTYHARPMQIQWGSPQSIDSGVSGVGLYMHYMHIAVPMPAPERGINWERTELCSSNPVKQNKLVGWWPRAHPAHCWLDKPPLSSAVLLQHEAGSPSHLSNAHKALHADMHPKWHNLFTAAAFTNTSAVGLWAFYEIYATVNSPFKTMEEYMQ